jgi:DNA polymerase III sliding clamp (beta) subunit (PCNA family)
MSTKTKQIISCIIDNGIIFKNIIELLSLNMENINIRFHLCGISIVSMSTTGIILFSIELNGDEFIKYNFNTDDESVYVGLNAGDFNKILKTVKRKDTLQLFIDSKQPSKFGLKITNPITNKITTNFITIVEQQVENIKVLSDYPVSHNIQSNDFQKLIKNFVSLGDNINIKANFNTIKFESDEGNISSHVEFGESDEEILYNDKFLLENILPVLKACSLSKKIKVCVSEGYPLCFRLKTGDIGEIKIFIKN